MGFGLLFIGYLFFFSFPYKETLNIPPDLLGFIISYMGIRTLAEYGCGWENLKRYFSVIFPASVFNLILQILNLSGILLDMREFWAYVYEALMIVYNLLLLVAIHNIAKDTEVKSIQAKAKRNTVLMLIYYTVMLIVSLPVPQIKNIYGHLEVNYSFTLVLFIFNYLWHFLNLALVFSCYMWICKEGDEEMPEKEHILFTKKHKEE